MIIKAEVKMYKKKFVILAALSPLFFCILYLSHHNTYHAHRHTYTPHLLQLSHSYIMSDQLQYRPYQCRLVHCPVVKIPQGKRRQRHCLSLGIHGHTW